MKGPLIAIVGLTGSGKTALALEVARRFDGEIICADSRTAYKGMDIGTAKPTLAEQAAIPHHCLDIVTPDQQFTVAQFQVYAREAIADIQSRGKLPILVGGSGLYTDSILFNYKFRDASNPKKRAELEAKSLAELTKYCTKNNITLPENKKNKRYIIRAIEQDGINTERSKGLIAATIVVGITVDKDVLLTRITKRAMQMLDEGVIEEAKSLANLYGWENVTMISTIYLIIHDLVNENLDRSQAIDKIIKSDIRLAKKQQTWFKRNPFIHWSEDTGKIMQTIEQFLKSYKVNLS